MKTTYLKNKLLEHITGVATYTKPTNTYIGLFVGDPGVSGSLVQEMTGAGYARELVDWGSAADGFIANDADVEFENLPSSRVKYWGILDASTNGNLLEYFPFEIPIIVPATEDLTIDAGNLVLREG